MALALPTFYSGSHKYCFAVEISRGIIWVGEFFTNRNYSRVSVKNLTNKSSNNVNGHVNGPMCALDVFHFWFSKNYNLELFKAVVKVYVSR